MTDWSTLPPLAALRAFAAYVETGSVTDAGRALNVSHAAISQQLRALERHLGTVLLDRSGRTMIPTPEGARLAAAAATGFAQMAQVAADITGADARRPLNVTCTPSFAAAWLMPRLGEFGSAHPDISLMVNPTSQMVALEPGGVDVALRYGRGVWPGLEAEFLIAAPLVVVAAPDLIGDAAVDRPEDLVGFTWLEEVGFSEASQWYARQGIASGPVRRTLQMPGNLVLEGVRTGQGIGVMARPFAEADIQAGRMRVLFEDVPDGAYYIVTRPGVLRPAARIFIRFLRRHRTEP